MIKTNPNNPQHIDLARLCLPRLLIPRQTHRLILPVLYLLLHETLDWEQSAALQ